MDDKIIFKKINQLTDDNEKASLIPLIQNEDLKEVAIKRYINDDKIKLQLAKNLQSEATISTIYIQLATNEDIIDNLILELEKMSNPFYSLYVIDGIPNSEKSFNKKIIAICNILARENITNKSIEQAEKILQRLYSFQKRKVEDYNYKDFLSQLNNDNLIINLISLLKINNNERNDLYSLLQNHKLREQALLMISPKEKLMENYKPKDIKTIGLPSDLSIGIELEAEGVMSIAFNNTEFFNNWKSTGDESLKHGVEVISPKLYDTQNDIEDLYLMTNLMKDFELTATERCGGHIHLGANYLDTKESLENLWLLWLQNEKIIYKSCNAIGEDFRDDIELYASPISKKYDGNKDELIKNIKNCKTRDELVLVLKNFQRLSGKQIGLYFSNINEPEKNTIEFRTSNGTLDFEEIKNNIRLYGRLFVRSKEVSIIQKKYNEGSKLSPEEIKKLQDFQTLCGNDLPEENRANIFINFLFEEDERDIYINRYKHSNTEAIHFGKDSYKKFYEQLKSNDKKVPPIFDEIEGNNLESGDYVEH